MEADTSTKFSPSKLGTYQDCPRRYRYRYVDRIARKTRSVEAFLGTCVHTALEALYEGVRHGKPPPLEDVLKVFDREWKAGWSDEIVIRDKDYAPEDWKALGRECVRSYYKAEEPFTRERTVDLERRVGFELEAEGGPYRIEGFIDRLALGADGAFEIHDYKTSKTLPEQAEVDSDRQLALYDIAVRAAWPDTAKVRLVWHYVRHGKTLTSERSDEQREKLKSEVSSLISQIKRDHEFSPRRSALCDWCEYRDLCPLFAHAERVAQLPPAQAREDEGVRLVDQLADVDARRKELRERLRELERDQKALEAALIRYAEGAHVAAVTGTEAEAAVSEKEEYKLPTKTHSPEAYEALERELKESSLWKDVSHLDSHRLLEAYKRREWPAAQLQLLEGLLGRFAKLVKDKAVRLRRFKEEDEG